MLSCFARCSKPYAHGFRSNERLKVGARYRRIWPNLRASASHKSRCSWDGRTLKQVNAYEEVPWDQLVKGYEYEKDKFVVLTDEDFKRADIEATQTIEVLEFVHLK